MAERTPSTRSDVRKRAAPYPDARPAKAKSPSPPPPQQAQPKGPLSAIFSGLYNFVFRPWGGRQLDTFHQPAQNGPSTSSEPSEPALNQHGEDIQNATGAQAQQQQPPATQQPMPPPPPQVLPPPPRRKLVAAADTSASTYSTVAAFLNEKERTGQQLNAVELAGVMTLLNESIAEEEKREPFRFSTSPPVAGPSSSGSASTGEAQPKPAPRMLTKNPNGPYIWNGAASARPRRFQNRYASPAFGTSRTPSRIVLTPKPSAEKKADAKGKKRRIDEPAGKEETSSLPNGNVNGHPLPATSTVPFPSTSGTSPSPQSALRTNGAPSAPSTPSRLRATGLQTKPAIPSPLRQAWRAEPDSPPSATTAIPPTTTATKPTRAATVMAELIKEMSPKTEAQKRRELYANPYEALSPVPVKPIPRKLLPRKRKVAETEKPEERGGEKKVEKEEVQKEKEARELPLSPQKIIEATIPKGAKRSRPPPELEKEREKRAQSAKSLEGGTTISPSATFGEPSRKTSPPRPSIVVEEVVDEELPRKKARTVNGTRSRTVTIEEVDDVDMHIASKPSVVKPSQVIEIDEDESSRSARKDKSPSPTFGSGVGANGFAGATKLSPLGGLKSSAPKVSSKLRYSFQAEKDEEMEVEGKDYKGKGKEKQQQQPDTSGLDLLSSAAVPGAPKISHAKISTPSPFGGASASSSFVTNAPPLSGTSIPPSSGGAPAPSPFGSSATLPSFGQRSAAPASSLFARPTLAPSPFIIPSVKSVPKTAEEVKNVVKVMAVAELPVYNFDIPLSSPGAGPSSLKARRAAETVPSSFLPSYDFSASAGTKPSPPAAPFNWNATALKPAVVTAGNWTCNECMLTNTASATDKCAICEAPRPGAAAASTKSGFDWSAAGIKKPEAPAEGAWTCGECMLSNPASAKEKCTVCEAPRPASAPPAKTGFDWAAAGMKKPENNGGWTCSVCMVSNPATSKKCVSCESDRS